MSTPMVTNWKKIEASKQEAMDPTLHRELIGSLMYLVNTRPNICFSINTLSQFMVEPRRAHWTTTKHILRYLRGTIEYGLRYAQGYGVKLMGYTLQIGQTIQWEKKALQGVFLVWDRGLSLGSPGTINLLH
jgi:hypothetical protein